MGALQPHPNVRYLSIKRYGSIHFPNWLTKYPSHLPNLVSVTLHGFIHCEHLPQLGQLLFLDTLKLSGMNAIMCMGDNTFYGNGGDGVFPRLKKLEINDMPNLEEWQETGGGEVAFFPKLTDLILKNCPKLERIPSIPSIRDFYAAKTHLLPLEKRFLENMKSMERLTICDCDQLSSLTDILPCDLNSLRDVTIRGCYRFINRWRGSSTHLS